LTNQAAGPLLALAGVEPKERALSQSAASLQSPAEPAERARYETIIFERQGACAKIVLNRPEKRNALTIRLFEDLLRALDEIESDEGIRVVILAGTGPAFCAGRDFNESTQATEDEAAYYGRLNLTARDRIRRLSKPVIASVHGPAAGGGCAIATDSCDIAIAGKSARFSIREVQAGTLPGLPILTLGRARSLGMLLTGDWVPAEQAAQWGLIYKAVPDEDLNSTVMDIATRLAEQPALAMAYTKRATNFFCDLAGYTQTEQYLAECRKLLHTRSDRRQAQQDFLDKRRR
jgi:2-(1,2-epoxy-1,2-dihydrophenyl)acetyl-CoA isomerase